MTTKAAAQLQVQCCENCRHWRESEKSRNPRRLGTCQAPLSFPISAIVTIAPTWPEQGRECVFYQIRHPR